MRLPSLLSALQYGRWTPGVLAQPGDHVNGIHEVTGSIPVSSTNSHNDLRNWPYPLKARRVSGGSVSRSTTWNAARPDGTNTGGIDCACRAVRLAAASAKAARWRKARGVLVDRDPRIRGR
jgi:hypothetical protein